MKQLIKKLVIWVWPKPDQDLETLVEKQKIEFKRVDERFNEIDREIRKQDAKINSLDKLSKAFEQTTTEIGNVRISK